MTRALGNMFIPILIKIVPYVQAFVMVLTDAAQAVANFLGFKLPTIDYSGMEGLSSGADGAAESLDNAAAAAKKLKDYTLGIDELNVISKDTGAQVGATGGGMGSDLGIKLPEYDFLGDAKSNIDKIKEQIKSIIPIVLAVGAAFAAIKIGTDIMSFFALVNASGAGGALATIGTSISTAFAGISAPVVAITAAVLAFAAGLTYVYATNEQVRDSLSQEIDLLKNSFAPLFEFISNTVVPNLQNAWSGFLLIISPIAEWLVTVFTSVWNDFIIPAISYISETVVPRLTEVFENIWNNVLVPIGMFLSAILTPIFLILSEVLTELWQKIVLPLGKAITEVLQKSFEAICDLMNKTVIPITHGVIKVFQFLWDNVFMPLCAFLLETFKPIFNDVFNAIGQIINVLKDIFKGFIDFITGVFTGDWDRAWKGVDSMFRAFSSSAGD
ncbi:MAG: hypothetical protein RSC01_10115, partial [Oscillospiraceae bacterium]